MRRHPLNPPVAGAPRLRDWTVLPLAITLGSCHPSAGEVAAPPTPRSAPPRPQDAFRYDAEYPAIGYSTTPTSDPVAALRSAIDRGDSLLEFTGRRGYLESLLSALDIDIASQVLVFSKTSLQVDGIGPETPRAIYFNDNAYVAWVPQAPSLEIATMDPQLGPVFHTLDQDPDVGPRFDRQIGTCLACHDSLSLTGGGVPRFITGSGYTGASGELVSHEGRILTSYRTPLRSRWGGWYVTGQHGAQVHLGNIVVRDIAELQDLERLRIGNLDNLDSLLDTTAYPSNQSDIVALLVLEHQVSVQNAITRCRYDTLMAVYEAKQSGTDVPAETLAGIAEALVEALFAVGEAGFTDRITGSSAFARRFEARGPRDRQGRSLRELDLETRLFKYPLSYLVYSPAFDALPEQSLKPVYRRIASLLRGDDASRRFDHLSAEDRVAIREILSETKSAFSTGGY